MSDPSVGFSLKQNPNRCADVLWNAAHLWEEWAKEIKQTDPQQYKRVMKMSDVLLQAGNKLNKLILD